MSIADHQSILFEIVVKNVKATKSIDPPRVEQAGDFMIEHWYLVYSIIGQFGIE